MKLRYSAAALLLTFLLGVFGVLLLPTPQDRMDPAEMNDIAATLAADFPQVGGMGYTLPGPEKLDYAVIDIEGHLLAATRRGLSEDVYAAVRHGDLVMDITQEGRMLGKVIFWDDAEARWRQYRKNLQRYLILILTMVVGIAAVFFLILLRKILLPFRRMRGLAERVAAGELDIPLKMERRNVFGAFTESFDLMREELRRARESEQAAEQSKRELVASLSHDIQTPVASIRAVAELMELTAGDAQRPKLQIIQQKAGQIHALVAELFHTTLEELHSLSVDPVPFLSDRLAEMIRKADDRGRARLGKIPGCLLLADPVRLAQVLDNIIANAYKYADTDMDVFAEADEGGLTLTLRDYGPGVDSDELPLLCSKYYRGRAAAGKDGYGLGLFIARTLTDRMGGRLECAGADPGFAVRLWLKFDGGDTATGRSADI
jgi:signal transduction histidine kinase